jgi:hypothetical protein
MAMRVVVVAVVTTVGRERCGDVGELRPTGAVGTGRGISTVDRCLDL